MASRRRRRKSIGKVVVDVERRVRRVEKRPGAKRLKANVVTTEKLGYRAVTTKVIQVDAVNTENIATDAVTANEAEFGVTVVSATDPAIVKEGTTVIDPGSGATKVYSTDINNFVTLTDAAAQAAAEGKSSTFYQDGEPTGGTYLTGDMWFDTNDNDKLYVWSGTAWVLAQDSAAAQAAADSKSAVYYQDNQPAGTAYEVGDIWIDTNDNDKLYAWDGTAWVLSQDSASAQATADGKAKTYVQNDEPTGGAYNAGDLWIDTNDGNKLYRYSGTAWVSAQDTAISTAQSTANGKNKVFYSTSAPGSTANTAGDIWWQYSSGIVVGQFVGAGGTSWTSAPIGNAVIANLDAGKITTGYLDVAGSVRVTTSATASGVGGNTARIEINSSGFFAYNGSAATVSITNTGTAAFTGTITGSSFTSTYYASGRGVAITSSGGRDNIDFTFGGVSVADITVVSGGLIVTGPGGSSITMPTNGSISLASSGNTVVLSTFARLSSGSSGGTTTTSGFHGILRNTWAGLASPSGGDPGDVWLTYT